MFKEVEKMNRTHSFLAAYDVGTKKGLEGDALMEFSRDFLNRTQFDYGDRPPLARGVFATPALFKLWTGNYQRTMKDAFREAAGVDGGPKNMRPLALMTSTMLAAGGFPAMLSGMMPGFKELEKASVMLKFDFKTALRESIAKHGFDSIEQDLFMYGLPTLAGINLSGNLSMGELAPQMQQGPYAALGSLVAGPVGAAVVDTLSKPAYIGDVNPSEGWKRYRQAERILPPVARDIFEGIRWASQGSLKDVRERTLQGTENPSPWEIGTTMLGVNPARANKSYESIHRLRAFRERIPAENINRRMAYAVATGDNEQIDRIMAQVEESLSSGKAEEALNLHWSTVKRMVPEYLSDGSAQEAEIARFRKDLQPEARRLNQLGR